MGEGSFNADDMIKRRRAAEEAGPSLRPDGTAGGLDMLEDPASKEGVFRREIPIPDKVSPDQWLDPQRKFYLDMEGVVCFGFGKHLHEAAGDHPDYLDWMLRMEFAEETKAIASDQLARSGRRGRPPAPGPLPGAPPSADLTRTARPLPAAPPRPRPFWKRLRLRSGRK